LSTSAVISSIRLIAFCLSVPTSSPAPASLSFSASWSSLSVISRA
jgi:hypothetical protein